MPAGIIRQLQFNLFWEVFNSIEQSSMLISCKISWYKYACLITSGIYSTKLKGLV